MKTINKFEKAKLDAELQTNFSTILIIFLCAFMVGIVCLICIPSSIQIKKIYTQETENCINNCSNLNYSYFQYILDNRYKANGCYCYNKNNEVIRLK